jgi:hypothetical protein
LSFRQGDIATRGQIRVRGVLVAALLSLLAVIAVSVPASAATGVVTASCTGNTLNANLQLEGFTPGTQVRVRVQAQSSGWVDTGLVAIVTIVAGQTGYSTAFDISAFRDASRWRVTSDAAGGFSATSSHLAPSSCAPPTEVPEAPTPLLIPLSLGLTAVVAESLRRRRMVAARS